jgi:hypothetical protein
MDMRRLALKMAAEKDACETAKNLAACMTTEEINQLAQALAQHAAPPELRTPPPGLEPLNPEFFNVPKAVLRAEQIKAQRLKALEFDRNRVLLNWQPYALKFQDQIVVKQVKRPLKDRYYHNFKLGLVVCGFLGLAVAPGGWAVLAQPSWLSISIFCVFLLMATCMFVVLLGKPTYQVVIQNRSREDNTF